MEDGCPAQRHEKETADESDDCGWGREGYRQRLLSKLLLLVVR
jgi:hypothetical protein